MGVGGQKGRGKFCNYRITISKIKEKRVWLLHPIGTRRIPGESKVQVHTEKEKLNLRF